jgi:hypothetical protein
VNGTLVHNGSIMANGVPGPLNTSTYDAGGGGAGGTILIAFKNIAGFGSISAAGGGAVNAYAGEGSGGFIRLLNLAIIQNSSSSFNGTLNVSKGYR